MIAEQINSNRLHIRPRTLHGPQQGAASAARVKYTPSRWNVFHHGRHQPVGELVWRVVNAVSASVIHKGQSTKTCDLSFHMLAR